MITTEQREQRRKFIGSSDSARIAGVAPYGTAADVFAEKCFGTEDFTSEAIELGNMLEPVLIAWAADQLGMEVEPNVSVIGPCGLLAANLDARAKNYRAAIEAKTSGIMWAGSVSEQWGDEETAQVPDHVWVQCQHQMYCADLDVVHVPALLGGRGRQMFRVPRDEKAIANIVDIDQAFWENHVKLKRPPTAQPSLDVVKRIKRVALSAVVISSDLITKFIDARDQRLTAEDVEEAAQASMLLAAGDAEEIIGSAGDITLTYFEQVQNRKAKEAHVVKFRKLGGIPRREKGVK